MEILIVMIVVMTSLKAGEWLMGRKYHMRQEEAMKIMEEDKGVRIVDVRSRQEYAEGHIPGAICIPLNELESRDLGDKKQKILAYCQMGSRSKNAVKRLAQMGYEDVHEFGGLNTWQGEIVKGYG